MLIKPIRSLFGLYHLSDKVADDPAVGIAVSEPGQNRLILAVVKSAQKNHNYVYHHAYAQAAEC